MSAPDDLKLNPEQQRAVDHPGGALMVFAGAGSGKTRVITSRIARLLGEGVAAQAILAVTFTNKAAREMRERIEELAGDRARGLWMGTFHSVCARILRVDGHNIGIDRNFVIYDDGDQTALVRDILKEKGMDEKSVQPRGVLNEISRAKERLMGPNQYAEGASGFFERIVAEVYPRYQDRLRRANALDFDDLLMQTVRLLEQHEPTARRYQQRFEHVLVDEYQDVNYAQYMLANLIAEGHGNITIVGDDDQSIYAWRGADVELMLKFSSDWPEATVISLTQNYRSTKRILEGAHSVIRHNSGRNEKQLWTDNDEGVAITVTEAGTERDEAMMAAESILKEERTGRRNYGDFAVLYRTNAQSRAVEEAFLTMRIPHVLLGGQRFYDRKEIKDMVAYLRLVWNPMDEASIRRVLNVPARGIGDGSLAKIEELARDQGQGIYSALQSPAGRALLKGKAARGAEEFVNAIESAKKMEGGVAPLLQHLMQASGYLEMLQADRSEEALARRENLQELLNVTAEYDESAEDPSLGDFLETVALMSDVDGLNQGSESVSIMTLHSSKGLEFPVVFMLGMEEGVFPHSRSLNDDTQLSEERRLCYVGMTRAREELHMVHAERRALFGQPSFNPRSRFLDDLPSEITEPMEGYERSRPTRSTRMRRSTFADPFEDDEQETEDVFAEPEPSGWVPPFQVGQKVKHPKFGHGIVVSCSPLKNDCEVTVAFPGATGIKKMHQGLAKLEQA